MVHDGEWINATMFGDIYQVEINAQTGKYRYRKGLLSDDGDQIGFIGEWTYGRPPEGPHAEPT